jgi:hypothetical protein
MHNNTPEIDDINTNLYQLYNLTFETAVNALNFLDDVNPITTDELNNLSAQVPRDAIDSLIRQVHNETDGHFGTVRTLRLLNKHFPGHGIPYKLIFQYIESCPVCQKERIDLNASILRSSYRTIKENSINAAVGIDDLTIQKDIFGFTGMTVICNLFSKLAWGYPYIDPSAEHVANSLLDYFCHYGVSEVIRSDPGSVLTGHILKDLNIFYGTKHKFSLVDVHTSNGVEPVNGKILRHLRALTIADRVKDRWSSPPILCRIFYIINRSHNSELSNFADHYSAYHLTFGTINKSAFESFPTDAVLATKYMSDLNADFKSLHEASAKYQQFLIDKRLKDTVTDTLVPGDLVLRKTNSPFRLSKLTYRFQGPFEVISQHKGDVCIKHLTLQSMQTVLIGTLKHFHGSMEDAIHLAMLDADEYWLKSVDAWLGHSNTPRSIRLKLTFDDGTSSWNQLDAELFQTKMVEDYIRSIPELFILTFSGKLAKSYKALTNRQPLNQIIIGYSAFVDLRYFGFSWFEALALPDTETHNYMAKYVVTEIFPKKHKYIFNVPDLDNVNYTADPYFFSAWGYRTELDPTKDILLTKELKKKFPKLKY